MSITYITLHMRMHAYQTHKIWPKGSIIDGLFGPPQFIPQTHRVVRFSSIALTMRVRRIDLHNLREMRMRCDADTAAKAAIIHCV